MRYAIVISVLMLLMLGCSDDKSTSPQPTRFTLTGRLTNQNGNAAIHFGLKIRGHHSFFATAITDSSGVFHLVNLPADTVTISFDDADTTQWGMPFAILRDTVLYINSNTVVNLSIREIHLIFSDSGDSELNWFLHGGARHDSTGFVFSYLNQDSTYMQLRRGYPVPDSARDIGFILHGQAGPSGWSNIVTSVMINGQHVAGEWTSPFNTTTSYSRGTMELFTSLPGNDIQLVLSFDKREADQITIKDIWIYSY
jgi:hypothetical protein